jgi:hypothetical protein
LLPCRHLPCDLLDHWVIEAEDSLLRCMSQFVAHRAGFGARRLCSY